MNFAHAGVHIDMKDCLET